MTYVGYHVDTAGVGDLFIIPHFVPPHSREEFDGFVGVGQ